MNDENVGTCLCCGKPWGKVKKHVTQHSEKEATFPLCENCWAGMSPKDRLPFYEALIIQWEQIDGYTITAAEREEIRAAVLAGK